LYWPGARFDTTTEKFIPYSSTLALTYGNHSQVWTGSQMLIWGGNADEYSAGDGYKYDPTTDSWTTMGVDAFTPTAREKHVGVWTGSRMIIWGGHNVDTLDIYSDGASYDPVGDSWSAIATGPVDAYEMTAVWDGTYMLVFGGTTTSGPYDSVGRYNPTTDTWSSMASSPLGLNLKGHTAVLAGSDMIIWCGKSGTYQGIGAKYNSGTNSWTSISNTNAPSARNYHTAVWTGGLMLVWGGINGTTYYNDGAAYNPTSNTWYTMTTTDVPVARAFHAALWDGTKMQVVGGLVASPSGTPDYSMRYYYP
jgi:N-acetylneuraminic acid mutarotase